MKEKTKQTERYVESVLAALEILDCFISDTSVGISTIIQRTGFTRNRVMRLVGTLCHKGYLVYDSNSGDYTLGLKLLSLGHTVKKNHAVVISARPILKEVAHSTGESVSLYGREGFDRVVMAREEGTQEVRYTVQEGQRMHLYAGAAGKVLLAFSGQEIVDKLFAEKKLNKLTEKTIGDYSNLVKELQKIRAEGVAESLGERVSDAYAVAAPVFGSDGSLVAALSIAGPANRFTSTSRALYRDLMRKYAEILSKKLGYGSV